MVDIGLLPQSAEIALKRMTSEIAGILGENLAAAYIYGSCTLGDFRPGWSDIDILVLTEASISKEHAERLVGLRQEMSLHEPENTFYRCFEGGMLSLGAFLDGLPDRVVYWGTSGQRIADNYSFDAFCRKELIESGQLLCGRDIRNQIAMPGYPEIAENVRLHFDSIRKYSHLSGKSIYFFGWILDIARCIYTLRTGSIISKTAAGEWALKNGIFDDDGALKAALNVRKDPQKFHDSEYLQNAAAALDPAIQRYADVLEIELGKNHGAKRREDRS